MLIGRFLTDQGIQFGEIQGETVHFLAGEPFEAIERSGKQAPLSSLKLLTPTQPQSIVCVGLNYFGHISEVKMEKPGAPVIFSKFITSMLNPGESIIKPDICERLDYEAELAVVIRRECRFVKAEDAADYILGYTCLNDVTARDLQSVDGQWARSKGFDTFCPFGPWVSTELDISNLNVSAVLNGKTVQQGNTSDMMFSVPKLIQHISAFMTLHPGDVIATGTPEGIGPMNPGDEIKICIDGLGELVNTVT